MNRDPNAETIKTMGVSLMNIVSNSSPLSSLARHAGSAVCLSRSGGARLSTLRPLGREGWRSEASAEDLVGEILAGELSTAARRSKHGHRWQGAWLCALPLTVAMVAGVVACLQIRA